MATDVEPQVGQDVGDLERMHEVGLARPAHLALVLVGGEHVGPPQQLGIGVRVGGPHLLDEVFEPDHGKSVSNKDRGSEAVCRTRDRGAPMVA